MGTTVTQQRSLSSSVNNAGVYAKTELWRVTSTTVSEPEVACVTTGIPLMGALVTGTTMRVNKKSAVWVDKASDGSYVWDVTVGYASPDGATVEPVDGTEIWTITSQLAGGTVKQARSQDAMAGSPDVGLLVGVKDDGTVEGGPWGEVSTTLSITLYKTKTAVTQTYIANCIKRAGKVNSVSWYGFDAGEVRLEGISIPSKLESLWALQFDFAIRANEAVADLPTYDAPAAGTRTYSRDVLGWEYPWLREIETVDAVTNDKKVLVEGLYIAKFFKESSFAALGLSGSLF